MNYYLTGLESYNLRARRNEIIAKTVGRENEQFAVSVFRGSDEPSLDEIVDDCRTMPFFAENKVVIFENPSFLFLSESKEGKTDITPLISYLSNPTETTTFILYVDQPVRARNAYVTQLCKYLKLEKFDILTPEDFTTMVKRDLGDNAIRIEPKALAKLIDYLPISVENWKQELEKLKLYPGTLNTEAIEQLIPKRLEDDAFKLCKAINAGDASQANRIYNELLINKKEVMPLIGLVASSYRFIFQCLLLNELGYNRNDIAQRIANGSDYRVRMAMENAHGRSAQQMLSVLNDLSNLDQDIKSGKVSDRIGLELFIMRNATRERWNR